MSSLKYIAGLAGAVLLAGAGTFVAAQPGMGGSHHDMAGSPAEHDYMEAMETMRTGMMRASDRDPSRSWALMMIEHHRGAIAMSRVVLANTRDPQIRRMASMTISAQTREIAEMQRWLDRHGGRQPRP